MRVGILGARHPYRAGPYHCNALDRGCWPGVTHGKSVVLGASTRACEGRLDVFRALVVANTSMRGSPDGAPENQDDLEKMLRLTTIVAYNSATVHDMFSKDETYIIYVERHGMMA